MRAGLMVAALLLLGACGGAPQTPPPTYTARITELVIPETPDDGRKLGCVSFGHNVGSGLSSTAILSGGVDRYLRPNEGGVVKMRMVAEASGYDGNAGPLRLRFNEPIAGAGHFSDAQADADGWFEAHAENFVLPVPVLEDLMVNLTLSGVTLTGRAHVTDGALHIEEGALSAYATYEAIADTVAQVRATCVKERPPKVCNLGKEFLGPETDPDVAVKMALTFFAGMDARWEGGHPASCRSSAEGAGPECNALSACFGVTLAPQ